jgi:peptidyl-prolyl cis-trans isomerase NIMA-interacting 1
MRRAPLLVLITALTAPLAGCDSPPAPTSSDPAGASASATGAPAPAPIKGDRIVASSVEQPVTPPPEAPPEVVAAQHVLVAYKGAKGAPPKIARTKADAKKRAEEALAKARKGDDFSGLVKAYSDEPGAADRLGNLGKFKREAMAKPFADAAFALKVGEVSDVVETEFGFHVIKRNQ